MGDESKGGRGEVLRLRNLAMIENIRRAHDPAWRERLEQQQLLARLGRMFGRAEDPLQALQDHADALKAELHTSRNGSRSRVAETARANDAGAGRIDRVANRPDRGSCEDDA